MSRQHPSQQDHGPFYASDATLSFTTNREEPINPLVRVVTDNGANYRAKTFARTVNAHGSRHQRTRPYTPQHNGKVERYQRILAKGCLYAHAFYSEDERREAITVWVRHYNYHRPHTA